MACGSKKLSTLDGIISLPVPCVADKLHNSVNYFYTGHLLKFDLCPTAKIQSNMRIDC